MNQRPPGSRQDRSDRYRHRPTAAFGRSIRGLGELAAVETLERLLRSDPDAEALLLFEDTDVEKRRAIVDERIALISTGDFLRELEAARLIQSADHVLDQAAMSSGSVRLFKTRRPGNACASNWHAAIGRSAEQDASASPLLRSGSGRSPLYAARPTFRATAVPLGQPRRPVNGNRAVAPDEGHGTGQNQDQCRGASSHAAFDASEGGLIQYPSPPAKILNSGLARSERLGAFLRMSLSFSRRVTCDTTFLSPLRRPA